ncbi:SDR family NAD(P)-dependent oxidoreductase [Halalkalibacter lacteus]|uniref:SDR family NAD(P)-dependent oxidoreductase n=1 Tax=Halalkalibacter lacteus TaxID=3090663 RepID=UPI002FC6FA1F
MKRILITGAGSGLGKELALSYCRLGHNVILLGRTRSKLEIVKNKIQQSRGKVEVAICNISSEVDVQKTVDELLTEGNIDLLINNAGVGYFGPLQNYQLPQINEMIDTNIKGTIYLSKALLPHFLKQNRGKIMNIISTAGQKGKVNESVYVASKFAIRGFTESLVKELEQTPIIVTAVYMGGMDTPFWANTNHIKDQSRLKNPKEIAKIILENDHNQNEIFIN